MTTTTADFHDVLGVPAGTVIVDVDTHRTETPDLWTARAPAHLADRLPRVVEIDGGRQWVVDGTPVGPYHPSSVIDQDGGKLLGLSFAGRTLDQVHAGSYDIPARLALMDEMGVAAQIVYPNNFGFGGQHFIQAADPDLRLLAVQIFNDWNAEMQDESGQRLFGMAIMPWWDVAASVTELERCAAMGMRGINLGTGPHLHGLPDLSEPDWDPLWAASAEHAMPVNFHIGASGDTMSWFGTSPWPSHDAEHKLAIGSAMMYLSNASVIANLIFGGVLERHPDVQFVSVESGIGWIPFFLESLDYQLEQSTPGRHGTRFSLTPSEYFRRQMHACFWFEERGVAEAVAALGDENVLFETDYPHPTCLYPDSLPTAAVAVRSLPEASRRRVLGENAIRLYRLPLG